jgi:hypothetical protein
MDDDTVIHFINPTVQMSTTANTVVVSGKRMLTQSDYVWMPPWHRFEHAGWGGDEPADTGICNMPIDCSEPTHTLYVPVPLIVIFFPSRRPIRYVEATGIGSREQSSQDARSLANFKQLQWEVRTESSDKAARDALLLQSLNTQLKNSLDFKLKMMASEIAEEDKYTAAAAGAIPEMVQLAMSSDAAVQRAAVEDLHELIDNHEDSQSAAAAAGAISQLVHLTLSSDNSLQRAAVEALAQFAASNKSNECAASAIPNLLVRQFLAASPQQQTRAALALVQFCIKQGLGQEWQNTGCKAGAVAALVQATNIADAELQTQAVTALASLVANHKDNQSAAAAAGAIPQVVQLIQSSDAALQRAAVAALGFLVAGHNENLRAAGAADAVERMCSLLSSSTEPAVASAAVVTLNDLTGLADNCRTAVSLGAVALLTQLKGRKDDKFDQFIRRVPQTSSSTLYANRFYHCNFHHCVL